MNLDLHPDSAIDHAIEKLSGIDQLEAALVQLPQVQLPIVHRFTPGLYIREIQMPAGTVLTSMVHKTTHPFTISAGRVIVVEDGKPGVLLQAPHTGITTPGTRRALHVIEDTIWTTYHVTEETDPKKLVELLTELPSNPLLPGDHRPNCLNPPALES